MIYYADVYVYDKAGARAEEMGLDAVPLLNRCAVPFHRVAYYHEDNSEETPGTVVYLESDEAFTLAADFDSFDWAYRNWLAAHPPSI